MAIMAEDIEHERDEMSTLIAAMQADAAPEPGTFHAKDVIHRGDEDVPVPVVAHSVSSAGYITVYHTETAEPSVVNRNMLPQQLQKKLENGKPAFTTRKPDFEPKRGTYLCLLHADHPRRAEFAAMGFPTCGQDHIPSAYEVRVHMEHRHGRQWQAIEEVRKHQDEEEERAIRKATLANLGISAGAGRRKKDSDAA